MNRLLSRGARGPLSLLGFALAALGACTDAERSITAPALASTPSLTAGDAVSLKPADPTASLTIYRIQNIYLDGAKAVVQGTVQCSSDGVAAEVVVALLQREAQGGAYTNGGQGTYKLTCTTSPRLWYVEIYPTVSPFTEGPALVQAEVRDEATNTYSGNTERRVKLVPGQVM